MRWLLLLLVLSVIPACSDSPSVPKARTPAKMIAASDTLFTGIAGTELTSQPTVQVLDTKGDPLSGVTVHWHILNAVGSITPSSVTDTEGKASAKWMLGDIGGMHHAAALHGELAPVNFHTTVRLARNLAIVVVQAPQTVASGSTATFVVRVEEQDRSPAPGVRVTWHLDSRLGTQLADTTTDSTGTARFTWTAPSQPGTYQIYAAVEKGPSAGVKVTVT